MNAEQQVRDILMKEFLDSQSKNAQYSMRAYSRKVGIPQSAVSEIMSGKRKITTKMASKILTGLGVDPRSSDNILKKMEPSKNESSYKNLDIDQFHVISDWHYFAILSLAETKDFKADPKWIARRLGISLMKVEEAIEKLIRLEMIGADLKPTGIHYQVDPGIATAALKKAHRQNTELAREALESTQFDERDFTAITLCFDPDRMNEASELIKEFRKRFATIMENGAKKEVYKLNVQLYPLTKNKF